MGFEWTSNYWYFTFQGAYLRTPRTPDPPLQYEIWSQGWRPYRGKADVAVEGLRVPGALVEQELAELTRLGSGGYLGGPRTTTRDEANDLNNLSPAALAIIAQIDLAAAPQPQELASPAGLSRPPDASSEADKT